MITLWTIMVITFGEGQFQGYETFLPFSSSSICGGNIMPMRAQLEEDGLEIAMIRCIKTTIESGQIE